MPDLVVLLENAEVMGKFTATQKQRLVSLAVRRVLGRDKALFWQGDHWTNVFLIASGQLRALIRSLDGRSYIVSTWEKGDEFWAHGLFDGEPAPSTLETAQESVIYQWEGEAVLQILFENPEAIRALLARQTRLIRKRWDTISDLAFQPVTGRVAKLLDILQKSWCRFEFQVVDGRNQIETQPKAFSPITVALTQDPKDFQLANDVLDQNALLG